MQEYLDIVQHVLDNGQVKKPVRKCPTTGKWVEVDGGISTLACANVLFSHDMSGGFPLLTTKKMAWKSIRVELEGFIRGITDKSWFQDRGCKIWNEWANPMIVKDHPIMEQFSYDEATPIKELEAEYRTREKEAQKEINCLGPIYGASWRNFDGDYISIPQILTPMSKHIQPVQSHDDDHKLVGTIIDGKHGKYTVISYDKKDKYHNNRYSVKFHTSGFIKHNLCKKQIIDTCVYDPYYPLTCGVACMGEYKNIEINNGEMDKDKVVDNLKYQWRQMIHRCYNKKHMSYKNYGEKGIYVKNSWLIFANFLKDVQLIDGWKYKIRGWEEYCLDKDKCGFGCYGPKECEWTTITDNANHTSQQYYFDVVSPSGKSYHNEYGLNRFCVKHNLKTKTVEASIAHGGTTHKGWKFIRKGQLQSYSIKKGADQLKTMVDTLLHNPMDRRMVCSAWNPNQIHMMALPACHWGWNVTVIGDELNLFFVMRSCDSFLGLPLNIASYALLLELLAYTSGLKPGNLSAMFVDCHLYENQIDTVKEQLKRKPRNLPNIMFTNKSGRLQKGFNILDWTYEDVELLDYYPHPKLAKVNVVV